MRQRTADLKCLATLIRTLSVTYDLTVLLRLPKANTAADGCNRATICAIFGWPLLETATGRPRRRRSLHLLDSSSGMSGGSTRQS